MSVPECMLTHAGNVVWCGELYCAVLAVTHVSMSKANQSTLLWLQLQGKLTESYFAS